MYGIMTQDGNCVLCHFDSIYVLERWNAKSLLVVRQSELEIDQLLQESTVKFGRYDLRVFKLTWDQEERQLLRRLQGI
jgi:hypothetical protein